MQVHIDISAWPSEEGYVTTGLSAALGPNQIYQFELRTSRSMLIRKTRQLVCSTRNEEDEKRDFPSSSLPSVFIVLHQIAPFSYKLCTSVGSERCLPTSYSKAILLVNALVYASRHLKEPFDWLKLLLTCAPRAISLVHGPFGDT